MNESASIPNKPANHNDERENEVKYADLKAPAAPSSSDTLTNNASAALKPRRALQDVSNAPSTKQQQRQTVQMSPNFGKRPRSESMEVVDEALVEKKTRQTTLEDRENQLNDILQRKSQPTITTCTKSSNHNTPFVVRIALDHTVGPDQVVNQEEYDDDLDPQMCEEYAPLIYDFMYNTQEHYMVNPSYIHAMPAGHRWYRNRSTLLNWVVTVHRKFRLVAETLYLATNMIDRFLSVETVGLEQVQLLAASCLFVASKYEEVITPAISNFAYIANSTVEDLRMMEQRVLVVLQFELGYPCPLNFLRKISRADDYDMRTRTVAKFLLEMIVFEPRLMVFRPSDVAAAAMYVARQILGMGPWTNNFIYYSGGCTEDGLSPIVEIMTEYLQGPCEKRDPDFIRQYTSKKVLKAALLAIKWARGESLGSEDTQHDYTQSQTTQAQ